MELTLEEANEAWDFASQIIEEMKI